MDKIALIRSMVSSEKEHDRAIALVRTGYPPSPRSAIRLGARSWPGSANGSKRTCRRSCGSASRGSRPRDVDAGVLGVRYNPFKIDEAGQLPPNLAPAVAPDVVRRRLALAEQLDGEFARLRRRGGASRRRAKSTIARRGSC